MKIAIIGRSELMFNTAKLLLDHGFKIPLIITSKAAPEYTIKEVDFQELAREIGATFLCTSKLDTLEVRNAIRISKCQVSCSVNFTGVISQEIIDFFPYGILNAHGGDLPKYRGNACQAWAIINQEEKIGLCIHKMIGGELDSGDILDREFLKIHFSTRIGDVYDWMKRRIPLMFVRSVNQIVENPEFILERQSIDVDDALRCYPRLPEDGRIFWTQSSMMILRLINASSEPFSGAFCDFEETKCIVWRAELWDDRERYLAVPGQITLITKDKNVVVVTGDGKLLITDVEVNGIRDKPGHFIQSIRKRLR